MAPTGCERSAAPPVSAADLERGAYLVNQVTLCTTCHAERDWSLYSGPPVPGSEGRGGIVGVFGSSDFAPRIDAEALAPLSVKELASRLGARKGVGGRVIHLSPFLSGLEQLTPEDARVIAAYLKSPTPVVESSPPDPSRPVAELHDPIDTRARGEYLMRIGRCAACHGPDLSGGVEIEIPLGRSLPSANITIHPTAGIGRMNRAEFIDYFKSLDSPDMLRVVVPEGELNTAMPWPWLAGMAREDLGSIYDYLATQPAVDRAVAIH